MTHPRVSADFFPTGSRSNVVAVALAYADHVTQIADDLDTATFRDGLRHMRSRTLKPVELAEHLERRWQRSHRLRVSAGLAASDVAEQAGAVS